MRASTEFFLGLETLDPDSLRGSRKKQNRIDEYRDMLLGWKQRGVVTWAGYIIGFAQDTRRSVLANIATIQRELPVDFLEFFVLTPLPGSADHRDLMLAGATIDADLNRYDTWHEVSDHPRMSRREWTEVYWEAWRTYYSLQHMTTLLHRAAVTGISLSKLLNMLLSFWALSQVERLHPLEGGFFRRKARRDRRPGKPIVPVWQFLPTVTTERLIAYARIGCMTSRLLLRLLRICCSRNRWDYQDQALESLSLLPVPGMAAPAQFAALTPSL